MDNLAAFVDNLSARGPDLHLAIVGVGRKKSHFMGPLAAFMDNLAALMDNQVCRPTAADGTVIFLISKRRVYKCAMNAKTTKNQGKRSFSHRHG